MDRGQRFASCAYEAWKGRERTSFWTEQCSTQLQQSSNTLLWSGQPDPQRKLLLRRRGLARCESSVVSVSSSSLHPSSQTSRFRNHNRKPARCNDHHHWGQFDGTSARSSALGRLVVVVVQGGSALNMSAAVAARPTSGGAPVMTVNNISNVARQKPQDDDSWILRHGDTFPSLDALQRAICLFVPRLVSRQGLSFGRALNQQHPDAPVWKCSTSIRALGHPENCTASIQTHHDPSTGLWSAALPTGA